MENCDHSPTLDGAAQVLRGGNLLAAIPAELPEELTECLASSSDTRILRIVSLGHVTPPGAWYDQDDTEWVLLIQGQAQLLFEGGDLRSLQAGDYLTIPAGCRHRVEWTSSEPPAIWLAVHYRERPQV
jgi:cupin 2 domain-containing protein